MTGVQERLQTSRIPLDKWSTREQLCLASAVSCSGDQNWMSVSRTLRLMCGSDRPADWFSQKSCAVQYGYMLENVDVAKRKKRASEGVPVVGLPSVGAAVNNGFTSGGETSTDFILRRLTEERIQELKEEIQKEQVEYAKVIADLKEIQRVKLNEEAIADMWKEVEKEQGMQRIEEMKIENQLREREQCQQEMQRNWKSTALLAGNTTASSITASVTSFSQKPNDNHMVINLEEIIGSSKIPTIVQQQATSPLLSSLLKSPTAAAPPAHASAPTITTLLTGGALNPNQPALTLKSTIAPNEAVQLLTRPISGPPNESFNPSTATTQNLLSPSQSAPTLSMLLEKNKISSNSTKSTPFLDVKTEQLVSDSNNEEVPMDIEEDVGTTRNSNDQIDPNDSDADANEEQQLLEVFKNIGNIDELEDIDVSAVIDEEVDFLKSVGDDNADVEDDIDFETKMTVGVNNALEQLPKNEFSEAEALENSKQTNKINFQNAKNAKVETISSDDSNDNIPLATLGSNSSHDYKDNLNKIQETFLSSSTQEENDMVKTGNVGNDNVLSSSKNMTPGISINQFEDDEDEDNINGSKVVNKTQKSSSMEKSPESVSSDVIIIPTDEESNGGKLSENQDELKSKQKPKDTSSDIQLKSNISTKLDEGNEFSLLGCDAIESSFPTKEVKDFDTMMQAPPQTTISLADTDDDSSTTDISISTKKDEKNNSVTKLNSHIKKDKNEHKIENDRIVAQTPVKLPTVRKLRDRDRSESPLTAIDDDTTASEHSVTQRSRRRYSSTPIIDSIPNSPASSDRDDRDLKTSKKSLMSTYNILTTSKLANDFQRVYNEKAGKLKEICNRFTDLHIIKKNIDNNVIRNVHELQRDFLLMCQNAIMVFETNSSYYKIAYDFMQDCQNIKEFLNNECIKDRAEKETKDSRTSHSYSSSPHSGSMKVRGSSRKSQRIS